MSPRVNALFQKATEIVALIFTEFEPAPGSAGARLKAEKIERENKKRERDEANKDSQSKGDRRTRPRYDKGRTESIGGGRSESEAIEEGESESFGSGEPEGATHDRRSDFGSDVDETGLTPDPDGGVAFFDAITEQLKKPGLSSEERVRLHLLQLFGGKG